MLSRREFLIGAGVLAGGGLVGAGMRGVIDEAGRNTPENQPPGTQLADVLLRLEKQADRMDPKTLLGKFRSGDLPETFLVQYSDAGDNNRMALGFKVSDETTVPLLYPQGFVLFHTNNTALIGERNFGGNPPELLELVSVGAFTRDDPAALTHKGKFTGPIWSSDPPDLFKEYNQIALISSDFALYEALKSASEEIGVFWGIHG